MTKFLTDAQMDELEARWASGQSRQQISDWCGIPSGRLFDKGLEDRRKGVLAHPRLKTLPCRQGKGGGRAPGDGFDPIPPAPSEIRRRCQEIQSRWSPEERMARTCAQGPSRGLVPEPKIRRGDPPW